MKLIAIMIMLTISSSSYALPPNVAECLAKENGRCVSINEKIINNTVDILSKVPSTANKMLFGDDHKEAMPLQSKHSLQECMKGKKVIDIDVINCRNGI